MTTFAWLFIGHLVGDWLFQNDWMAQNKQKALFTLAGMSHFLIYTVCVSLIVTLFAAPLSLQQLLSFSAMNFICHWLIDALALAQQWGRMLRQSQNGFVTIVVDQSMHFITLGLLAQYVLS